MRILFIGTVMLSRSALEKLIGLGEEVAGVVTKRKSDFHSDFADLGELCARQGIPVFYAQDINQPVCLDWIRDKKPDLILCVGWSQMICKDLLAIPRLGVIGYHPALLPKNRGRHPLVWALVLGLEKTGSTFFLMDEGADSGDIVSQEVIPITYEDTAATLYGKVTAAALKQMETFLPLLKSGRCPRRPQNPAEATYWQKRGNQDGCIDWHKPSREIYNLVRALTRPYPGAHMIYRGVEYKVWRVKEAASHSPARAREGEVLMSDSKTSEFKVQCGEGVIHVVEHDLKPVPRAGECL